MSPPVACASAPEILISPFAATLRQLLCLALLYSLQRRPSLFLISCCNDNDKRVREDHLPTPLYYYVVPTNHHLSIHLFIRDALCWPWTNLSILSQPLFPFICLLVLYKPKQTLMSSLCTAACSYYIVLAKRTGFDSLPPLLHFPGSKMPISDSGQQSTHLDIYTISSLFAWLKVSRYETPGSGSGIPPANLPTYPSDKEKE